MSMPLIFMFSGQGSQYYHAGENLFEGNEAFRKNLQKAEKSYCDLTGHSILAQIYDKTKNKGDPFTRTQSTHPAIFLIEYALAQTLLEMGIEPQYLMGASLGEYAALAIAGILSFENALQIVIKQAEILERCPRGLLLAIFHDPRIFQELQPQVELAGINFNGHFVVAGSQENIHHVEEFLKSKKVRSQILAVSQGFHSSLIDQGKMPFLEGIHHIEFQPPRIPVISCATGNLLTSLNHAHLWDAIRLPIQFQETIQNQEKRGGAFYLDTGPSGTLSTFVKYNLSPDSKSKNYPILTLFGTDVTNFDKAVNALRG